MLLIGAVLFFEETASSSSTHYSYRVKCISGKLERQRHLGPQTINLQFNFSSLKLDFWAEVHFSWNIVKK
uniref:Secreted protein n=1 Tax=Setaria viridis TaxID=4556 RepID=A0A4U6VEF7_SETVI|nr:hypothetical protein SEVIR_3G277733v2 [Setaria viridis]